MTGSPSRKFFRLLGHFIAQPRYFFPYIRSNIISRVAPVDLKVPWFSYNAIDFLKEYVRPSMSVFEYGSGGSTIFFAKRCALVVSTEDNRDWLQRVEEDLEKEKLTNAVQQYREFALQSLQSFKASAYLNSIPARKFDIIVVDGADNVIADAPDDVVQARPICFYHAENFIASNGIIIVDDSWAYSKLRHINRAKEHRTFQSVGPCRFGVTSTDIFFY